MSEARFGRFSLLRPVRKGGLGLMSLAWDHDQSRPVGLKRARSDDARFADEAAVALRLQHRNLARGLEAGDVDGTPWLALEWLEGQDLDALLERARKLDERLPLPIAGNIVRQVLSALEALHAQKVVHRDVAPRNVMIGYDGVVRLVDYGLALAPEQTRHTMPGVAPGTAGFLAPEQRSGKPEAASDLYAAGALLFFALTGAPYFGEGEDGNSKEPFRLKLAGLAGELPPSLVGFLWRALQKSPTQRFESARKMGAALAEAVGTPLAPEAAVGGLLTQLFPVEKKLSADEVVAIEQRFKRETLVIDRSPPPDKRRPWLVWVAAAAALLVAGEVSWLLIWRSRPPPVTLVESPPPPPPVIVEEKPPVVVEAEKPPIEKPPVVVEPEKSARSVHPPRPPRPLPPPTAPPPPEVHVEAARTKVGLAEIKLREANYPAAIALAGEAIQLGGADLDAHLVRGFAELRAGRKAEATRDFQHVLERDPANAAARSGLKTAEER